MIVAISVMRDEADVAGAVVSHLYAHGVDRVLVYDNLSTDGTGDVLRAAGACVFPDDDPGHNQDKKMSTLAVMAYEMGAKWVLPFDADEFFYPTNGGTLTEFFATCEHDVIEAYGYDHIVTGDEPGLSPFRRTDTQALPKVAFQSCTDPYVHMGNHDVDRRSEGPTLRRDGLSFRHFQYRSLEHYIRKVRNGSAASNAAGLHWEYNSHWHAAAAKTDDELAADWLAMCSEEDLIVDPAPVLP